MKFGERLSALRKKHGLSQEALAEKLGISRQAVSKWENGEAFPELSKLDAICQLFSVTPNDLMGYENKVERMSGQGISMGIFWLVVGCMGFIFLLLTDQDWLGLPVTIIGMLAAYFEISGRGNFFRWLKREAIWLFNEIFKDGNAMK